MSDCIGTGCKAAALMERIAALSPERVLAMIAVIEAAKAMRAVAAMLGPTAEAFDSALAALDKEKP